eukprot:CAMPEP_0170492236 /NCGR_PEP_ID=MMETSP0208-20121228/11894_1 /TAXON_ID=197538 /ORGANISM="Strombidium inclinatum, Strain S3" /LENGTH=42 /DNA_ID= /DNA_START= /DNA_END= /DNA_ORIENTATION=
MTYESRVVDYSFKNLELLCTKENIEEFNKNKDLGERDISKMT